MICYWKAIADRLAPPARINSTLWLKLVSEFDQLFTHVVGRSQAVLDRAAQAGRRWYQGQVTCREAFG